MNSFLHPMWFIPSLENNNKIIDLSIESLRSQEFSVGMFFFLLFGIALFSTIVFALLFGKAAPKGKIRRGEKIMFVAIILGIVFAIFLASLQMLQGYLL